MTNEERKVIELALEALEYIRNFETDVASQTKYGQAAEAIKEALAQPKQDQDEVDIRSRLYQRIHELETQLARGEQEPCKTCNGAGEVETGIGMMVCDDCHGITYTNPPQRTWVGLTEEDIDDAEIHLTSCRNNHESWIEGIQEFAQAIEAKLKDKNHA